MSTEANTTKAGARTQTRPEGITDEHLQYLDDLRDSGDTNMFGAGSYLQSEFDIDAKTARGILSYWMESFGKGDR